MTPKILLLLMTRGPPSNVIAGWRVYILKLQSTLGIIRPAVTFFAIFGDVRTKFDIFKKIRWLVINLSYFHAKFQQKMIKIEVKRAKKRRTKPKLRIHMPINWIDVRNRSENISNDAAPFKRFCDEYSNDVRGHTLRTIFQF